MGARRDKTQIDQRYRHTVEEELGRERVLPLFPRGRGPLEIDNDLTMGRVYVRSRL